MVDALNKDAARSFAVAFRSIFSINYIFLSTFTLIIYLIRILFYHTISFRHFFATSLNAIHVFVLSKQKVMVRDFHLAHTYTRARLSTFYILRLFFLVSIRRQFIS